MLSHVFIVPDGNRRWARRKDISIGVLYKHISDNITTKLIEYFLLRKGINEFSVLGLSRYNVLNRNKMELETIQRAQAHAYKLWKEHKGFNKAKIKFNFVGDFSILPDFYVKSMDELMKHTKNFAGPKCNVLVGYDGRWEITRAFQRAKAASVDLTENNLWRFLEFKSPIDLLIRSGQEKRISGGPTIQLADAEFYFMDFHYPEFTEEKLDKILEDYQKREKRFGK